MDEGTAKIKADDVMCEIGWGCRSFCTTVGSPALDCWQPLDAGQSSISCTGTLIISVTQPSLSHSFSICLLSPFTYFWGFFFPPHSLFAAFCSKGKNPEAKNDIKPPERLHRDYCLKMPALPVPPLLPLPAPEISLPLALPFPPSRFLSAERC